MEADFAHAVKMTAAMLKEFEARGMNNGHALSGALTHLLSRLIKASANPSTALGILSVCMGSAAFQGQEQAGDPDAEGAMH